MVIALKQQNFYYDMAQKPHTSKGVESRLRIPVTPDTPGGRVLAPHLLPKSHILKYDRLS